MTQPPRPLPIVHDDEQVGIHRQRAPQRSAEAQRDRLHHLAPPGTFADAVDATGQALLARSPRTLQLNLGKLCNQRCHHCHVDAGPERTEVMGDEIVDHALHLLDCQAGFETLDLTGGAPELHPRFEEIVRRARAADVAVMDRCNLTILTAPRFHHLPRFLADHEVEVVASLPATSSDRTDAQRGDGVFEKSIEALQALNAVGYGQSPRLVLTLVSNPAGAFLPASEAVLEADFKAALKRNHDVDFTRLIALTNMPISRFLDFLDERGTTDKYLRKLVGAFNGATVDGLMCRSTLSVGWDGHLYDCDFNQMLEIPEEHRRSILDLTTVDDIRALSGRRLQTDVHCFGCTAGQGSSCGGAIANSNALAHPSI